MEHRARGVVHLVELVDAAHATIGEDERSRLKDELSALRVAGHVRRETDGGRTFTAGVDTPGSDLVDIGQDLRLGGRGVTAEQHVDVSTVLWASSFLEGLVRAAEQLEEDTLLHVIQLVDRRCQRAGKQFVDIRTSCGLLDLLFLLGSHLPYFLKAGAVDVGFLVFSLVKGRHVGTQSLPVDLLDV